MATEAFSQAVLADAPVGYWRLGEAQGGVTAADASGQGNDGTSSGGVTFGVPGLQDPGSAGDTAALFDGATGRITVPNTESLNPARITMEGLVRWDGPTGSQQRIVEKESFAGTTQFGLSVQADGRVRVELRRRVPGAPDVMLAMSTQPVVAGAATHVVATYDGLAVAIYLHGALDSSTTVNTLPVDVDTKWPHDPPGDPEVALVIGDRMAVLGGTQRTFNGLIDEVAVYDTALSPDRIQAHYDAETVLITTKIDVSATDNELYIIAVGDGLSLSSELCHITSGFNDPVAYTVRPQAILPPGKYTLIMVGINWGGPQAFTVTLTTNGVATTYTAPANSTVGANWTVAVPITV